MRQDLRKPSTTKWTERHKFSDWDGLEESLRSPSPVSGVAFDYEEGEHIAAHSHSKSQLIYAVQGTMTVSTVDGSWVLLPARAVWVPASFNHSIRVHTAIQMRTLYLDPALPGLPKGCAVIAISPFFRELILELLKEPRIYQTGERADHIAALIRMELTSLDILPLHLPWPKNKSLRQLCAAMRKNPGLRNNGEVLADSIGVSKRTLERMFQKELGMTFSTWRTHLLLLEAQVRLAHGHSSQRIAKALGYESQSAFIAMFKRYLQVPPMDYFANTM
jgi:AraC-like DNA-binding protein/quercetin dioxygenase-like cupin family protein